MNHGKEHMNEKKTEHIHKKKGKNNKKDKQINTNQDNTTPEQLYRRYNQALSSCWVASPRRPPHIPAPAPRRPPPAGTRGRKGRQAAGYPMVGRLHGHSISPPAACWFCWHSPSVCLSVCLSLSLSLSPNHWFSYSNGTNRIGKLFLLLKIDV